MGVGAASLWTSKLKKKGISVEARTSAGSGENMKLLAQKKVQLAIVEGIFAKSAWNGIGDFQGKPNKEFRTITMLWPNVEHFVVNKNKAKTGTLDDIKGLTFSVGPKGSGTERTSLTMLSALGITKKSIKVVNLGFFDAALALVDQRIDGATLSAGPPVAAVTAIFGTSNANTTILEVTNAQLDAINAKTAYPGYRFVIAKNTYPGQDKAVKTIAQPNLLVCRKDVPEDVIYQLTNVLHSDKRFLRQVHAVGRYISRKTALQGLPAPLHAGAYKYYKKKRLKIPPALKPVP